MPPMAAPCNAPRPVPFNKEPAAAPAPAPAKAESLGVSHPVNIVATKVRTSGWRERIFISRIGLVVTEVGENNSLDPYVW